MKATKTVIYLMIAVVGMLMLSYFTGRTAEHIDSQQIRDRKFYPVGMVNTLKATRTAVPYATQSISTSSTLKGKKELADENVKVLESAGHSTVLPGSVKDTDLTPKLVSENKPATSDVRGNLGPASCVTNETMLDWLTDRWQGTGGNIHIRYIYLATITKVSFLYRTAAKNMKGEPIPGEHWVEIDLLNLYYVSSVVLDWEVAFSNAWSVQVF
jgi:hypothetical protein